MDAEPGTPEFDHAVDEIQHKHATPPPGPIVGPFPDESVSAKAAKRVAALTAKPDIPDWLDAATTGPGYSDAPLDPVVQTGTKYDAKQPYVDTSKPWPAMPPPAFVDAQGNPEPLPLGGPGGLAEQRAEVARSANIMPRRSRRPETSRPARSRPPARRRSRSRARSGTSHSD